MEMSGTIGVLAVSTCWTHWVMLLAEPYILQGDRSRGAPASPRDISSSIPRSMICWMVILFSGSLAGPGWPLVTVLISLTAFKIASASFTLGSGSSLRRWILH